MYSRAVDAHVLQWAVLICLQGATELLATLKREFTVTMALCGFTSVSQIDRSALADTHLHAKL
jgi:isopentenyl diphosphate isomerase/L-lactate dehydrogenase-like FMN-dependent dehydrogenase